MVEKAELLLDRIQLPPVIARSSGIGLPPRH